MMTDSLQIINPAFSRLMQNRKSAKKCRLKKKAEFGHMRGDVIKLQEENKNLKEKVPFPSSH
jgi:bZIP transcription factor